MTVAACGIKAAAQPPRVCGNGRDVAVIRSRGILCGMMVGQSRSFLAFAAGSHKSALKAADVASTTHPSKAMTAGDAVQVIVLGGGAAGMLAAITAGRRGRRVKILERNAVVGRKIRISGGGRCNFTNTNVSENMNVSFHSSHKEAGFFKTALEQYPPEKFIAMVESHGIKFHEKKLGQLFCNGSAQQLVDMLKDECRAAGVEIVTNTLVSGVSLVEDTATPAQYRVSFQRGDGEGSQEHMYATSVIVASGGLSYARSCGSTDLAYRIASSFGLKVTGIKPGLVPLVLPQDEAWTRKLTGVSLKVRASISGRSFEENVLFTHKGVSGPSILQVSSFWSHEGAQPLVLDLAPNEAFEDLVSWMEKLQADTPSKPVHQALQLRYPRRFADAFWLSRGAAACRAHRNATVGDLSADAKHALASLLKCWEVKVDDTEGYPKAEVTCGGVDTTELSDSTLEVLKQPGLFFIGEAVDVTGWLGGYNLQWAWASGYAAGLVC